MRETIQRVIEQTKSGLNSKMNMVCDGLGRHVACFLWPGQMSAVKGARHALPSAKMLLSDKGYDAD